MGAPSRERLVLLHAWPDGDFFEKTRGSQRVKIALDQDQDQVGRLSSWRGLRERGSPPRGTRVVHEDFPR